MHDMLMHPDGASSKVHRRRTAVVLGWEKKTDVQNMVGCAHHQGDRKLCLIGFQCVFYSGKITQYAKQHVYYGVAANLKDRRQILKRGGRTQVDGTANQKMV